MRLFPRYFLWISVGILLGSYILQVPPRVWLQRGVAFGQLKANQRKKTYAFNLLLRYKYPLNSACTGQFTVHNDTSVFDKVGLDILGPSGYTLELRPTTDNLKFVWAHSIIDTNNVAYLIPSLDLDFIPVARDLIRLQT